MDVPIFLAADYANITSDGKINIMGIFQSINAPSFPVVHISLVLVMKLVADLGEYDERELAIKLLDGNGKEQLVLTTRIKFGLPQNGRRPEFINILELNNTVFQYPDRYQFALFVEKDCKSTLGIDVIQINKNEPKKK
jgi:hypothetical protein